MKEIKGIEKVVEESKDLRGYESGFYLQLNYNPETGDIWTDEIVDYGHNSCVRYDNPNILHCGDICNPISAQEIMEILDEAQQYC